MKKSVGKLKRGKKIPKKWEFLFPRGQVKAVMKLMTIVENEVCLYPSSKQSPSSEVNQIFFPFSQFGIMNICSI